MLKNQLRLVVEWNPIIYKVLAPSQVVGNGISEPSTVGSIFAGILLGLDTQQKAGIHGGLKLPQW